MTDYLAVVLVNVIVYVIWLRLSGSGGYFGNLGIPGAALAPSSNGDPDCTDQEASDLFACSGPASSSDRVSDCTDLEAPELSDCSGLDGIEINFF